MAKGGKAKDRTSRAVDCLLRILLMGISDSHAYGSGDRVSTRFFLCGFDKTSGTRDRVNGVPVSCRAKVVSEVGMPLPSQSAAFPTSSAGQRMCGRSCPKNENLSRSTVSKRRT